MATGASISLLLFIYYSSIIAICSKQLVLIQGILWRYEDEKRENQPKLLWRQEDHAHTGDI